jgi:hypothetical protein
MRQGTFGFRLFTLITALGAVACGGDAQPAGEQSSSEPIAKVSGAVGPLAAPIDGEDTICVTRRMTNAEGGYVRRVTGGLTEGSHHLIVYRSEEVEEKPEPEHCDGLSGIFVTDGGVPGIDSANVPIFIAQQRSTEIVMPREPETGKPIGFRIEPQQMIRYEFHWYNTTQTERQVAGNFELEYIPDSAKIDVVESSFAFWGTVDIAIDRRTSFTTPVIFQEGLTGTRIFATTTHQHKRGVGMRIWSSTGRPASPEETPITEGLDWAEPPLVFH